VGHDSDTDMETDRLLGMRQQQHQRSRNNGETSENGTPEHIAEEKKIKKKEGASGNLFH
jgi:hypothetical protein